MNTKELYEGKSVNYKINAARKTRILNLIPENAINILDIGCAGGELAREIKSKRRAKIYGIDISQKSLDSAGGILDDSFCFDVENDNWPQDLLSKKFDLIIASEIIEHLFLPDRFLKKVMNLLTPGGKIIITTPNFLFWKNRFSMLLGKFEYTDQGILDSGHVRFFTMKTAKKLFNECGLRIERECHFYPNLYKRKLNFLGSIFPGFFAYQMIFLLSDLK